MKLFLTVLVVVLGLSIKASADVTYTEDTKTLQITGPTTMPQVVKASNLIRGKEVLYVEMWGPGGELEMGLSLGRFINKIEGVTVTVPKDKVCASACALAAMGAKHIRIDGEFLLHRPYVTGVSSFYKLEDIFAHMGKGYLMTAYYLEDMGYNRSIMRSMLEYTSPCKFMSYEDLEIKQPEDLKGWKLDNSRCEMMNILTR